MKNKKIAMQRLFGMHYKWFTCSFASGAGITLALGFYTQFHAVSNDFWNILYYGRHMTLSEPGSLYNGFFPFGYAFLIGQLPFTYILPLSYAVNALLAGLFTASVSTLAMSARSTFAAFIAFLASIVAPYIFKSANTLSPDMGSVAFTAFAVFLLWRNQFGEGREPLTDLHAALAGTSLGMSLLWRNHAVVSSVAILAGYFLYIRDRSPRPPAFILGAFLLVFSMQTAVNLTSGHGPFETAQAFNIHKFFYGAGETIPPSPEEIENFSLIDTVMRDPRAAFDTYLLSFRYLVSFGWPATACFLLFPKGRFSRFSLSLALFVFLYAVPVALGDSPRAPVILMSVYLPSLALLAAALMDWVEQKISFKNWVKVLAGILILAVGVREIYGWVLYDVNFIRTSRSERGNLAVIEHTLVSRGMKSPTEVFADRYDFYTPHTMPYRSRQIGNWSQDWVWGYNTDFPPLPNDSWDSFSAACREQGIHFLVLSPNSFYRGEIFPPIYHEEVDIESLGLQFVAQRGNIRIYEFK